MVSPALVGRRIVRLAIVLESHVCHIIYTSDDRLSVLRLGTATTASSTTSATVLTREVASRALTSRSTTLGSTTTAAGHGATAAVASTTVGVGLGATGLDNNTLAINGVRVGGSRSLVTFRGLVLDESTILFFVSYQDYHRRGVKRTFWRLMSK